MPLQNLIAAHEYLEQVTNQGFSQTVREDAADSVSDAYQLYAESIGDTYNLCVQAREAHLKFIEYAKIRDNHKAAFNTYASLTAEKYIIAKNLYQEVREK